MNFGFGAPRSGTAHLAYLLSEAGFVQCRHEFLMFTDSPFDSLATANKSADLTSPDVRALMRWYHSEPRIEMDCFSFPWIMRVALEEFPEAKVVHLVRDPRMNVKALYNLDWYGEVVRTKWERWASLLPRVDRPDWDQLTQLEKVCSFWVETHRQILDAVGEHPYLRVRFEDLTRTPPDVFQLPPGWDRLLRELFAFVGAKCPPEPRLWKISRTHVDMLFGRKEKSAEMRRKAGKEVVDTWSARDLDTIVSICGEMAAKLGYDLSGAA